jgi:hypothetical protein
MTLCNVMMCQLVSRSQKWGHNGEHVLADSEERLCTWSAWLYALPKLNSWRTMPCLWKNILNPLEQSTRNLAGCLHRKDSNTFHRPWQPLGYCLLSPLMRKHSSLWSSVIFRGARCLQTHKDCVCSGPHAECHVTHLRFWRFRLTWLLEYGHWCSPLPATTDFHLCRFRRVLEMAESAEPNRPWWMWLWITDRIHHNDSLPTPSLRLRVCWSMRSVTSVASFLRLLKQFTNFLTTVSTHLRV